MIRLAMTPDQVEQAVIGFGSAIIGAIVGGVFVLLAARGQWKRDKLDASRQAARRILRALAPLEAVFATLLAHQPLPAAEAAGTFNGFSSATIMELPFITDDEVCMRVLAHVQLCGPLLMAGSSTPIPKDVMEAVRRHADAVTEAVEAHIRGADLPPYRPLPKNASGILDLGAFLSWPETPG